MPDLNKEPDLYTYEQICGGLPGDFKEKALALFKHQVRENAVYGNFVRRFLSDPDSVNDIRQIPFLPVTFFKSEWVKTGHFEPEIIFESSGTTLQTPARHPVKEVLLYRESFVRGFQQFYGAPEDYVILGLLPAYLERTGSSLVYMVDELIRLSNRGDSGFYLDDFEQLHRLLLKLEKNKQRTLLIGVSFALLDFAEKFPMQLMHTTVMETGGMKGRRQEITRIELHELLEKKLGIPVVHSEYGMTELLSQAYSAGKGRYIPVPWMKMLLRDEDDPLQVRESGEGLLNIIDLANRDSCAFLATDDVARLHEDGSFEILGRMDNSDLRGCSLMVVQG